MVAQITLPYLSTAWTWRVGQPLEEAANESYILTVEHSGSHHVPLDDHTTSFHCTKDHVVRSTIPELQLCCGKVPFSSFPTMCACNN